jgi:hypothetical protein
MARSLNRVSQMELRRRFNDGAYLEQVASGELSEEV